MFGTVAVGIGWGQVDCDTLHLPMVAAHGEERPNAEYDDC